MGGDPLSLYGVFRILRRNRAPQYIAQPMHLQPSGSVAMYTGLTRSVAEKIAVRLKRQSDNAFDIVRHPNMARDEE